MKDTSRNGAGMHGLKSEDTGRNSLKSGDTGRNSVKSVDVEGNGAKSANRERENVKLAETERNREKLKNNGVKGAGRMDAKIKKIQSENIQSKNAEKKAAWNKQGYLNPEEDPRFHDTYKFLRRYRDATYSLKVVVHQMEKQFRLKYGTSVDEFLDSIYAAGANLSGDDIEERAKSIERSNWMLKMLDSSVDLLRTNHKHGEQYYWILYYTFLSPQELKGTNEIIESLRPHISNISYRTYYRKRHAAIEALSTILWGFTAKETIDILNEFFPEE